MLDKRPAHYDDAAQWFAYFRMTKYLPAIPSKYEAEIAIAPSPQAARTVMTAYAAAAIDILSFTGRAQPAELAAEFQKTFRLHPNNLLTLSVQDIAQLTRMKTQDLSKTLASAGYSFDAQGNIASYAPPSCPPAALRPPGLR